MDTSLAPGACTGHPCDGVKKFIIISSVMSIIGNFKLPKEI